MRPPAAALASLRRDGYAVLKGAVPRPLVDAAVRLINNGLGARAAAAQEGAGPPQEDYLSYHSGARPLMELLRSSSLGPLMEELLGRGRVEPCTQAQVALRFPSRQPREEAGAPPIHVDVSSAHKPGVVERYTLCVGVMLSDMPRPGMGNFLVYPGSHERLAKACRRGGPEALSAALAAAHASIEPRQAVGKAGDAFIFHPLTAHDKGLNFSPEIRYMAYFRVYHRQAWSDRSPEYLRKALSSPWLELPGVRRAHGA